jgi:hypothetical protein
MLAAGCSRSDTHTTNLEPGKTLIITQNNSTNWIVVATGRGDETSRVSINRQEDVLLQIRLHDHNPINVMRWLRSPTNEIKVIDDNGDGILESKWVTDLQTGTTTIYTVESIQWSTRVLGSLPEDFNKNTEHAPPECLHKRK